MGLWALERTEVCEQIELHLLILMNLGDLLSFMEETSVRKEPLISSCTVNTVFGSAIKEVGPMAKPVGCLTWNEYMTPIKGEEVQL